MKRICRGTGISYIYKKIDSCSLGKRFLNDYFFRRTISIYRGMAVNFVYAIFKLITSWVYHSAWFAAIAVYYFLLYAIRGVMIYEIRKAYDLSKQEKLIREYRCYRKCGYLMIVLNAGMMGMVVQVIWKNQYYEYPGMVIYISAIYTFYMVILSIINLRKFFHHQSPVLAASKVITFSATLMSVIALQTALMAQFGKEDAVLRIQLNTVTSILVCTATFGMALYMILRGNKKIRSMEKRRES